MLILAFDLGDFNALSAWRLLDTETGEVRCGETPTTSKDLVPFLKRHKPDRVLCEACSMTHLLHDAVTKHLPDATFIAANTNDEPWQWSKCKRKTDAADAERLMTLDRINKLQSVYCPTSEERTIRRLITHRSKLISMRTGLYNSIRSSCKRHEIALPNAEKAWNVEGLERLKELSMQGEDGNSDFSWTTDWLLELRQRLALLDVLNQSLLDINRRMEQWHKQHEQIKYLRSAPGIGLIMAIALLVYIGDPHRFRHGKQVAAYFGLVPRVHQSGKTCIHGKITKAGNRYVRSLLINCAWQAVRRDPWAQEIFDRVCKGSKRRRKQAIVAVARRLLIRCWAMMRDGQSWPELNVNQPVDPAA